MNMLKQTKKRLIFLYTLTSGLLLTAILIAVFLFNDRQRMENNVAKFNQFFRMTEEEVSKGRISHSWLGGMEMENHLLISIYSNEVPLRFSGAWEPPTRRELLFQRLDALMMENGIRSDGYLARRNISSPVYSLRGQKGELYYGRQSIRFVSNKKQTIGIIWQLTEEAGHKATQILYFALLEMLGVIGLFIISACLVEKSLVPLREGLKKQSEFIAAASHELRSPLTVIRAGIGAIKSNPHKAPELLLPIEREGERMAVLIGDMLTLASSDANTWIIRPEIIQLDTLFISLYDSLLSFCKRKRQKLELRLPEEELSAFFGDRQRLEQVLMILMDNASAYSPEASVITILVSQGKKDKTKNGIKLAHYLQIEVIDHGMGISQEDKEQIFERFYRADKSRNDKKHFGLGLSIAAELITLLHGKIKVVDTPGGGSTFVIHLPAA